MIVGYQYIGQAVETLCVNCDRTQKGTPVDDKRRYILICDECQMPLDTVDARIALQYENRLIGFFKGDMTVTEPESFPTSYNDVEEFKQDCMDRGIVPITVDNLDDIIAQLYSDAVSTRKIFNLCMDFIDPRLMVASAEIMPLAKHLVKSWIHDTLPAKMVYYLDREEFRHLPTTPGVLAFRNELIV